MSEFVVSLKFARAGRVWYEDRVAKADSPECVMDIIKADYLADTGNEMSDFVILGVREFKEDS